MARLTSPLRRRPPEAERALRASRASRADPAGTFIPVLLALLFACTSCAADADFRDTSRHLASKAAAVVKQRTRGLSLSPVCVVESSGSRPHPCSRVTLPAQTRYANRLPIPGAPFIAAVPDPEGYNATALWLVSRHGSRFPTEQRLKQIASLASLFQDATNTADFPWVRNWTAPTAGLLPAAGELHAYGEDELWSLGARLRERFPHVLRSPYLPRRHSIVSTQVPRAAASAYAFAAGFFPRHHPDGLATSLPDDLTPQTAPLSSSSSALHARQQQQQQRGPGGSAPPLGPSGVGGTRPQAVAISMSPKDQDPLLRFYDACPAYASRKRALRPWLAGWLAEQWSALAPGVARRLGVASRAVSPCEVDALWTLCQFEAGLLGERRRGCAALSAQDRRVLEWLDDVGLLEAQGWGAEINYRIAAPLLRDLRLTLQAAAAPPAPRGDGAPGAQHPDLGLVGGGSSRPHARLLFAHCETLVPLATLLGLFEPELPAGPQWGQAVAPAAAAGASGRLQAATARGVGRGAAAAASPSAAAGSKPGQLKREPHSVADGVDACTSGAPPPAGVAPPEGWRPRTPLDDGRIFRGGRVSPFGANLAVVLYRRLPDAEQPRGATRPPPEYLVRLLYNEQVLRVPGCAGVAGGLDCELEEFLALTAEAAAAGDSEGFAELCAGDDGGSAAA